jgi:tetratricopeptide (TPR) repeat protein
MTENKRKTVMISSTARDLPEHREEVMDACLRQSMFPSMMEHLPAEDADAIEVSLRMVDEADVYLGVFAHRYGYVPAGHGISITEMEYNRAVERGIPRLVFVISDQHPIKIEQVEMGAGAEKLKTFKARLTADQVVNFFDSPVDLRSKVVQALANLDLRVRDAAQIHYVSDIPQPPEDYIAHPYTFLQTGKFVGRQTELNLLTEWIIGKDEMKEVRIFSVVAIGGMGKSALTWKWFNEIAPQETKPLAGRMWWSFYESDARFENFIIRALAYVTRRTHQDIEKNTKPGEREEMLLRLLDEQPYLIVLDGLERILLAYARMDAAYLRDDELDDIHITKVIAGSNGLPNGTNHAFYDQQRFRQTADPRSGQFLRRLTGLRKSRILVSTRLYPLVLQNYLGRRLLGCFALFLPSLSDDDALKLWRAYSVSGENEELLPLFNTFENHPLLLSVLASAIAGYRRVPGDFTAWKNANPKFNPYRLPISQVKTHVLEHALQGIDKSAKRVLNTVAAFRMPVNYAALASLLIGEGKTFWTEHCMHSVLNELEDRGLLGWNKRANRYDLHPIVRGVVWAGLDNTTRDGMYEQLYDHFEAIPSIDENNVESLEDLTPAIELYNTLIGLGRYEDACDLFYERLDDAMLYRLSAARQRAELLERLFPDGLDQLPRLSKPDDQAFTLNSLALAYNLSGQPGRAMPLYRQNIIIREKAGNPSVGLGNLSYAGRLSGALREAESAARRALVIDRERDDRLREAINLYWLGLALAACGEMGESEIALWRSVRLSNVQGQTGHLLRAKHNLGQRALWLNDPASAKLFGDTAWDLANKFTGWEAGFIIASGLQGQAALGLGDYDTASERLHHALARARAVDLAEEELRPLISLAEMSRQNGDHKQARELLNDVWEPAERGPYPLFHADAFNLLAQIERDESDTQAAVEAATKAYRHAWCDGPPYAYHWGLEKAKAHLRELGAPEPDLPPFDESQFEPLPEVEINPKDEFWVDPGRLDELLDDILGDVG